MPLFIPLLALLLFNGVVWVVWALEIVAPAELASVVPGLSVSTALRRGRGRPRKFAAPSRAVTLTLPESVLDALSTVHADLSQAVAQLAERVAHRPKPLAELSVFGNQAVITVRPTPWLERHAGVQLVPLPDGRALISFEQPRTIAELELKLQDVLDGSDLPATDRAIFKAIVGILKDARRSEDVVLHRRNIIVLERTLLKRTDRSSVLERIDA